MFHNTNMPNPNQTFHAQSHTQNMMHIRPVNLYACGTTLENTANVAQESM